MRRLALLGVLLFTFTLLAQEGAENDNGIYIIFDGSGSMWGQLDDGTHKIEAARDVLGQFVEQDFGRRSLALRVYGHRREGDCDDIELVQDFAPAESAKVGIKAFASKVNPKGKTPISRSLKAALNDFGERAGEIILISDGVETCDEDPCELVKSWAERDVLIKVHVVGLGLNEQERAAMQCIADASGTDYQDAQTGDELAAGLGKIKDQGAGPQFYLAGLDDEGNPLPIEGTLGSGEVSIPVSSEGRFVIDGGEYEMTVGVKTRNGNLYRPITETITVKEAGTTNIEVIVPTPPRVSVQFFDQGAEVDESGLVYVSQAGQELFRFRAIDEIYIDEGEYEFQISPNAFNQLTQSAELGPGDRRIIDYHLAKVVRAVIHFLPTGSRDRYRRSGPELWQDGEKKFTLNGASGGRIVPGTYDVVWPNSLTGYRVDGVVITDEAQQSFEFVIPGGHVTLQYLDIDGNPVDDKRAFVARADDPSSSTYTESGQRRPLPAGEYVVSGWRPPEGSRYPNVEFTVTEGSDEVIEIRAVAQ
ncbi:MAG: hypothetical protein AAF438_18550 [Pseudomonadota bacterium]